MNRLGLAITLSMLAPIACYTQEPGADTKPRTVADNPNIDFAAFAELAKKLEPVRAERRVPLEQFLEMAKEPGTIVLDTRSKWAFDLVQPLGLWLHAALRAGGLCPN
jgi:hypothetical protein